VLPGTLLGTDAAALVLVAALSGVVLTTWLFVVTLLASVCGSVLGPAICVPVLGLLLSFPFS
jgi:hypothetical protein